MKTAVNLMLSLKPQMKPLSARGRSAVQRAFTLVELLVVIAITVILFSLLLRPLVESLRLTQGAQVQAAAQDAGRITLERLTRELGSAVFVYDNASHPFANAAGTTPAGAQTDRFTNFLDLAVPNSDGNPVVEHAYNAKIDIVPARHQDNGGLTDPTAGDEPVLPSKAGIGSASLSSTGLLFPLAPSSVIVRYFVGLKDPTKPYTNSNEGLLAAASSTGDNTYILYVAQAQPYMKDPNNAGKYTVNTNLFATRTDANGNSVPELDDPDFFRYVTTSDVNWLSPTHAAYSTSEMADHNTRVDNWVKIAKSVITAPDIDLIQLPHDTDGSISYETGTPATPPADACTAGNNSVSCAGVSHSGTAYDPVGKKVYPIINTTVTFRPAGVEGDAAPATTTEYSSIGVPADAADNGGLPYIPPLYTASSQSWSFPYTITLYPQHLSGGQVLPDTTNYFSTDLDTSGATGDIIEYKHAGSSTPVAVYDVTTGAAITGNAYVPMTVNPDSGTINFAQPALPNNTQTPTNRYWRIDVPTLNGTGLPMTGPVTVAGIVDLTQLSNSPLAPNGTATGTQVANAHIVPGSLRVYGPDSTPGPNLGNSVLYSLVSQGTPLSFNEYRVDYVNNTLQFYVDSSNKLQETTTTGNAVDPVQISFDYQANMSPVDTTNATISSTNPAMPMLVKVDYQTRDLIDVNIGIRLYDNSQGHALIIPVSNRVQIGNSNR